jgi:putative PIN family toxin of toxin-antitoxin system
MNSAKSNLPLPLKVVFDTNVYISAILTAGTPRVVVSESLRREEIEILVSEVILTEIERILRLKIRRPLWDIMTILIAIRQNSTLISPESELLVVTEDEADNRIIECAFQGKAQYIVSGDRHLLSLREYQGIRILSPTEFLREIEG